MLFSVASREPPVLLSVFQTSVVFQASESHDMTVPLPHRESLQSSKGKGVKHGMVKPAMIGYDCTAYMSAQD